ncbi:hypothetical protein EDC01DRAFT_762647 [Geopyxis carbonaria]|nr:hypothetical protein EDC01DRAFT_762647 [Geopyxis carbonaria]
MFFSKLTALATASLLALTAASPSYGSPKSINKFKLPGNTTKPEGVAIQPNSPYFYTASTTDGTIYRGHLNNPQMKPFINGSEVAGMVAGVGLHIHEPYLIVAGGPSGTVFTYNIHTRSLVHRFSNHLAANETFLNDLAIHPESGDVYISDSTKDILWKIPGTSLAPSDTTDIDLTPFVTLSPAINYAPGFNGNGIVFTDDSHVILGDSSDMALFSICLSTKSITPVDLHGGWLGGVDGLVYKKPYLFSMNGFHGNPSDPATDYITVIKLAKNGVSGNVVGNITNPELLKAPATIGLLSNKKEFLAVNFQGETDQPVLPYSIVRIPIEW